MAEKHKDESVLKTEHLRVVVMKDGDHWVAQCLEYDIGAQAPDVATLQSRLRVAMLAELMASIEINGEPFKGIPPAPEFFHNLWDSCSGRLVPKHGTSFKGDGYVAELETALCA